MFRIQKSLAPIAFILIFVGITFFIRCYIHYPGGDEVMYEFTWKSTDATNMWQTGHDFSQRINSFYDILESQIQHYKLWGGRCIVHGIEQAFTNHMLLFSVLNTIVFITFVYLLAVLVSRRYIVKNYYLYLWLIICLTFIFPLPNALWTSVNLGLNYLWPSMLAILNLLIWQRLEEQKPSSYFCAFTVVCAFILGWSHESFSIPFSAAMLGYYLLRYTSFKFRVLWQIIPLLAGTTILFIAPGNYRRLGSGTDLTVSNIVYKLLDGVDVASQLYLFWLLLIGIVAISISGRRKKIKLIFVKYPHLIILTTLSILFSLYIHSGNYSFTFVELLSLILILIYLHENTAFFQPTKFKSRIYTCLSLLFVVHQIILCYDIKRNYDVQTSIIHEVVNSCPKAVVHIKSLNKIFPTSRPFLQIWEADSYQLNTLLLHLGLENKQIKFFNSFDIQAFSDSSHYFSNSHRLPGNAPVFHIPGSHYYWLNVHSWDKSRRLHVSYAPINLSDNIPLPVKISAMINPHLYMDSEPVNVDSILYQDKKFFLIDVYNCRIIKSFDFK